MNIFRPPTPKTFWEKKIAIFSNIGRKKPRSFRENLISLKKKAKKANFSELFKLCIPYIVLLTAIAGLARAIIDLFS